jgi:hypothetical protein
MTITSRTEKSYRQCRVLIIIFLYAPFVNTCTHIHIFVNYKSLRSTFSVREIIQESSVGCAWTES